MATVTFNRGDPLQSGSQLLVAHRDGSIEPADRLAEPLGEGASGAVYRGIQDGILHRAVKILAPSEELLKHFTIPQLVEVFDKEKKKLAQLTHSHIAKLVSFGLHCAADDGEQIQLPYLVMEFVEGTKLHEYVQKSLRSDAQDRPEEAVRIVVALMEDVLGALQYMHERNALHADVKEANVLVRSADRPEAVLVDLGCAHLFSPPVGGDTTYFNSTRRRNSDKWAALVGHPVRQADIWKDRVKIDLHQFGFMLRLLLKLEDRTQEQDYIWQNQTQQALRWAFGSLGELTLARVSERCVRDEYESANDVKRDISVLVPGYASPLGVPELAMGTGAVTSIAFPEGRVSLTEGCRAIVNHPSVQRLHGISQLDFLRLVFPGASHTRFLHSLEAFDLTRQYVAALCGDPVFRAYAADKASVQAILVAGLVHDVGHYPLEHVFEDFAAKREKKGAYSDVLTDDQVVRAMMSVGPEADRTEIRNAIAQFCQGASHWLRREIPTIPDLIERVYGKDTLKRIRELLCPAGGDLGASVLHSIIDGPIDVDKVAYLRTDALMTGVRYGRAIDIDGLLGSLTCFPANTSDDVGLDPCIAVRERGVCAVEAVATARRWMFQRVYWNHSNRAMMAMLRFPVQYLLDRDRLTFEEYLAGTYPLTDVEAVKWVHDRFAAVVKKEGGNTENPAMSLLEGRRMPYKRLLELGLRDGGKRADARNFLQHRPCCEWLGVASEIAATMRGKIPSIRDSDVLLDLPVFDRPGLEDLPVTTMNGWTTMANLSDEYRQTKDFFNAGSMYCRIFIHPQLRHEIAGKRLRDHLVEAILDQLSGG